jgi:hypothetical protein
MKKRDFMDLDNPLMAWMLDYDAVSACLRVREWGLTVSQLSEELDILRGWGFTVLQLSHELDIFEEVKLHL